MKRLLLVVYLVASVAWVQAANVYRDFTSVDGKVIRGCIKTYDATTETVTIERDNKKIIAKVPLNIFSEADQAYINKWKNQEGVRRSSKFKISCDRRGIKDWGKKHYGKVYSGNSVQKNQVVGKTDFEEIGYEISLENRNGYTIEGLILEYCIYYEQETKPDQDREEGVLIGSITIDELAAHKEKKFSTNAVVVYKEEKNAGLMEAYRLKGRVCGIALRFYMQEGDEKILLREEAVPSSVVNSRDWSTSSIHVGMNE